MYIEYISRGFRKIVNEAGYLVTSYLKFIGAFSSLRQFLAIESLLEIIKNAFYFTLKTLFVLKIFKFWSCRKTA